MVSRETASAGLSMQSSRVQMAARNRFGFWLTVPAISVYLVLILYPFVNSVGMSFFRSTLTAPEPKFVGFDNFERLSEDSIYLWSWIRSVVFVAFTTVLTVSLGFIWAILLNQGFRGAKLLRSLSLLPWVMPSAVTAILWAWILNGQYGVLNAYLLRLNFIEDPVVWLASPTGAMAAVVLAKSWLSTALVMTFFLASLQTLPMDQVEAARLDGATNMEVIRHVALPHVRQTAVVVTVLQAMGNLQQIDLIYALTGGGPAGATSVMSIEVYKAAFQNWDLGLASSIGVVWFITIAVPASVYFRSLFRG